MDLRRAVEALSTELASPPWAPEVDAARRRFAERTGAFASDDAWFEARSRAFWDDALTDAHLVGAAAQRLADAGDGDALACAALLARAHRGLFVVDVDAPGPSAGHDDALALRDLWAGARFTAVGLEAGTDDALAFAEGALDARVIVEERPGATPRFATWVLPGAVYHPPEALPLLEPLLAEAEHRGLTKGAALDALLRMELAHRKATRMKVGYAYRTAALAPPAPTSSGRLPLSGKWAMR